MINFVISYIFTFKNMAQNPLAIADVDNEVLREADEYLRKHKILELFEVSIFDSQRNKNYIYYRT